MEYLLEDDYVLDADRDVGLISWPCPRCKRGAWQPCALWCVDDKEDE